jgi:hypothetical protein
VVGGGGELAALPVVVVVAVSGGLDGDDDSDAAVVPCGAFVVICFSWRHDGRSHICTHSILLCWRYIVIILLNLAFPLIII